VIALNSQARVYLAFWEGDPISFLGGIGL